VGVRKANMAKDFAKRIARKERATSGQLAKVTAGVGRKINREYFHIVKGLPL